MRSPPTSPCSATRPRTDSFPPPAPGQGYADRSLEGEGLAVGDTIALGTARTPVEVIGWVSGTDYNLQSGLWVDGATWRDALNANIPDAAVAPGTFDAILVTPEEGVAPVDLAQAIDAAVPTVTTLTIDEAIAGVPGVAEQQSVFTSIIGTTFAVAGIVVALFFALLTIERIGLLGVLKAIGASSRTLAAGLTLQALLIAAGAFARRRAGRRSGAGDPGRGPAHAVVEPVRVHRRRPRDLRADRQRDLVRRIIRIDPASAVGGA